MTFLTLIATLDNSLSLLRRMSSPWKTRSALWPLRRRPFHKSWSYTQASFSSWPVTTWWYSTTGSSPESTNLMKTDTKMKSHRKGTMRWDSCRSYLDLMISTTHLLSVSEKMPSNYWTSAMTILNHSLSVNRLASSAISLSSSDKRSMTWAYTSRIVSLSDWTGQECHFKLTSLVHSKVLEGFRWEIRSKSSLFRRTTSSFKSWSMQWWLSNSVTSPRRLSNYRFNWKRKNKSTRKS